MSRYAELRCRTHYSFLRGASHPKELVERASALGLAGLAIVDRDGVYGMPKAYRAIQALKEREPEARLKLIVGAELTLEGAGPAPRTRLALLARDRAGYGLMCRLLTASHEGKPKGEAGLGWKRFAEMMSASEHAAGREGLIALPDDAEALRDPGLADALTGIFARKLYLPLARHLDGGDRARTAEALALSRRYGAPVVAVNDVHFHVPDRRELQDTLAAIRENTSLGAMGKRLFSNGERYLKSPRQMAELFSDLPEAVARTVEIAEQCRFCPSELRYFYPSEWIPAGETAQSYLEKLTWKGAAKRYGSLLPTDVEKQLRHELALIEKLGFADYFLTIWEIVEFARSRKILCQGRGSAANSAICYCLEITAVDPVRMQLLFERFLSAERGEPPDIDVDFEHERREEVIQYIYQKYGRDRAGMVAALITYRSRSSVRDVSKALGIPPGELERHPKAVELMEEISGFPRHLSIHSGGFTLSARPIIETVPIEPARMEGRTIVQWDKDDLDALGLLKVDVLALGMLSAIRKTFDLLREGGVELSLATVPAEDRETYRMIQKGDTVGVFQIESRAQIGMLKRLRPENFYDLVVEVAIVRPGPIVGQMVHPYLKRRRGQESSKSPHPDLEPILGRTLGVPLFQEQVMKMAIVVAGFTPGEADELRRGIGAWRSSGGIEKMGRKLQAGLLAKGLPQEFVDRIFKQIQGFAEYGFPESHAASFALLAYVSSYLKCHHPAEFACALINSQPMGFYSNHTLVEDAKRHGVRVLPVDPNRSRWDCAIEGGALRIGLRVVHGMGEDEARALEAERAARGPFASLADFLRRTRIKPAVAHRLAMGGAFEPFGLAQREALWRILEYQGRIARVEWAEGETGELDFYGNAREREREGERLFRPLGEYETIQADFESYGLSVRGHPMAALRRLGAQTIPPTTTADARRAANGKTARLAGLVIVRQRPPTAKGTAFATLEDDHGFLDLILHADVYEKFREVFVGNAFLVVTGRVQRDLEIKSSEALSLIVRKVEPLDLSRLEPGEAGLRARSHDFH